MVSRMFGRFVVFGGLALAACASTETPSSSGSAGGVAILPPSESNLAGTTGGEAGASQGVAATSNMASTAGAPQDPGGAGQANAGANDTDSAGSANAAGAQTIDTGAAGGDAAAGAGTDNVSAGAAGAGNEAGATNTDPTDDLAPDDRGTTPPSATAQFPFPQNRELPGCTYPSEYRNADILDLYDQWKDHLVTSDGAGGFRRVARVAEPGLQPNSTVSEGIAYGMLIAVYMDDQPLFDDLWRYALQYTWTSQGGFNQPGESTLLMNWYIHADGNVSPGMGDDPAGSGAATDADEDIAFALVMADRQWGGGGALDRSYLDYARELIDDIWAFEIADDRLVKNGSSWGDDQNLNISYFAPAYYRVFAKVSGDARWSSNVVDYSYTVLENSLNASNGNENNGLVPAWSTSAGGPVAAGAGQSPQPFHYQYDSCRTPFRIGQDACWNADSRATAYVAKTSQFFAGKGVTNIVDGYELNGDDRPEFPNEFGGLSGAFIGPAAVGAMHDPTYQSFVDDAYALLRQNTAWAGGQYYDESWIMLSTLFLSGNFVDFTQYD